VAIQDLNRQKEKQLCDSIKGIDHQVREKQEEIAKM
jgi:structural maintenance of chromosome 4